MNKRTRFSFSPMITKSLLLYTFLFNFNVEALILLYEVEMECNPQDYVHREVQMHFKIVAIHLCMERCSIHHLLNNLHAEKNG
jgi:hypothetical protein